MNQLHGYQLGSNIGESRPLLYIPFSKIDKEKRMVTGVATSEAEDADGETLEYDGSKKAVNGWPGNVREMHQLIAAGHAVDVTFDDDGKKIIVTSHISKGAQDTWEKVLDGTLTGYSVKGKVLKREASASDPRKARVKDWTMDELSLVDRPCNPECNIEVVKALGGLDKIIEQERRDETMATEKMQGKKEGEGENAIEDRLKKFDDALKAMTETHGKIDERLKAFDESASKIAERLGKIEEASGQLEERLKKVEVPDKSKEGDEKEGDDCEKAAKEAAEKAAADKAAAQKAAGAASAGSDDLAKAVKEIADNQVAMQKMFGQLNDIITNVVAMKAGGALPQRKIIIDKQYAGAMGGGQAAGETGAAGGDADSKNGMPAEIEALVVKKNLLRQQLTPEENLKMEKFFKQSIASRPSLMKGGK